MKITLKTIILVGHIIAFGFDYFKEEGAQLSIVFGQLCKVLICMESAYSIFVNVLSILLD